MGGQTTDWNEFKTELEKSQLNKPGDPEHKPCDP